MATQRKLLEGVAALRRVKDWDYINSHKTFVNPVPAMKEYCGKIVTVVDSIIPFELASQMYQHHHGIRDMFLYSQAQYSGMHTD